MKPNFKAFEFFKYKKQLTILLCPASCYNCYLFNHGKCEPEFDSVCDLYFSNFVEQAEIKGEIVKPIKLLYIDKKWYIKCEIIDKKSEK